MSDAAVVDPWAAVVGQSDAVARLRSAAVDPVHAYLLLGPPGVGAATAATAFAAEVLAHATGVDPDRARRLAAEGNHPDLIRIEPEGQTLRVVDADAATRAAMRSPMEADRKVIVIPSVDAIEMATIGKLLKIVEEPPPSTTFVLLAAEVIPDIVTIASRCVTVPFGPLPPTVVIEALLADGADAERAELAAAASGGDLDRARLLVTDDALAERAAAWAASLGRLDGTGATVWTVVEELRAGMDAAAGPLQTMQSAELAALDARAEAMGERVVGRSEIVARHKRELRRLRADELRFGFATLSRQLRDEAIAGNPRAFTRIDRVQQAADALIRNPNEPLLLQSLFADLGS